MLNYRSENISEMINENDISKTLTRIEEYFLKISTNIFSKYCLITSSFINMLVNVLHLLITNFVLNNC